MQYYELGVKAVVRQDTLKTDHHITFPLSSIVSHCVNCLQPSNYIVQKFVASFFF